MHTQPEVKDNLKPVYYEKRLERQEGTHVNKSHTQKGKQLMPSLAILNTTL